MFAPPKYTEKMVLVAVMALQLSFFQNLSAENLTLYVTENEQSRFNSTALAAAGALKGGLSYDLGIAAMYDSNVRLQEVDEQADLSIFATPSILYVSDPEGGARYSIEAGYAPQARFYFEESSLNDVNQNANVSFRFQGSRTRIELNADYNEVSAADRFTNEFSEGRIFRFNAFGSYQISPRSSVSASWSRAVSDYDSAENTGADVNTTQIGATWEAGRRLALGGSLRWIVSESDNTGTREALALLAKAEYRAAERLYFSIAAGPELSDDSRRDGGRETGYTGEFAARYVISERWTWNASARYVTLPSPSDFNFIVNDLSFSSGLSRQLLKGSITGGVDISFSEYEAVGEVTGSREDEENLGFFITYGRPLYSDRVKFTSSIRYITNEGRKDYDQWQIGSGVVISF